MSAKAFSIPSGHVSLTNETSSSSRRSCSQWQSGWSTGIAHVCGQRRSTKSSSNSSPRTPSKTAMALSRRPSRTASGTTQPERNKMRPNGATIRSLDTRSSRTRWSAIRRVKSLPCQRMRALKVNSRKGSVLLTKMASLNFLISDRENEKIEETLR